VDACLQLRCLAIYFLQFRAPAWRKPNRKHNFPSVVASIRVYRAVAWQRVYQNHYSIFAGAFHTWSPSPSIRNLRARQAMVTMDPTLVFVHSFVHFGTNAGQVCQPWLRQYMV
jgi:hypothetical protein